MMDPFTGDAQMLDAREFTAALRELDAFNEQEGATRVLVHGTEDEITEMSRRIRLGNDELERRRRRRSQQKDSRRRNR